MLDFPASPVLNQQFSAAGSSWVFDGTAWNIIPQMVPAVASDTPPANPAVGQFWWRASNGQLYLWYDDGNSKQWVQAAAPAQAPVTPARAWEIILNREITTPVQSVAIPNIGAFRTLRLDLDLHTTAVDNVYMLLSADNGATWISPPGSYTHQQVYGSSVTAGAGKWAATAFQLSGGNQITVAGGQHFLGKLGNWNNSRWKTLVGTTAYQLTNGELVVTALNAVIDPGGPCNALQIACGTTMTGRILVEGVR